MQPAGVTIMAKFRTRLVELREKNGLSRMDVVHKADMTYPTVMSWENNALTSVDADKVSNLMRLFNCTMADILYVVDESKTPGDKPETYLAIVRNLNGDILEMMAEWRFGKFHPHMSRRLYPSDTEVWAGLDASMVDYKKRGFDVHTGEDKPGQVSVLVSAMTTGSPFSHEEWIKVCEGWAVGELWRKLGD